MLDLFYYTKRGVQLPAAFQAVLPPLNQPLEKTVSARDAALRRLIAHAYQNVPYYKRLFDRNGIDPQSIKRAADLERIPVSSKDDLRGIPAERTLARGVDPSRLLESRTSGTSGSPFTVRHTPFESRLLNLSYFRPLQYYGRTRRDKIAAIIYTRPEMTRRNLIEEQIRRAVNFFPCLTIDMGSRPDKILKMLRWYRPDALGAYSGVLLRVAELVTEADRRDMGVRMIWVGGEMLTEPVRRRIASAFGARVYNTYASEEFRLIGWECRESGAFHLCNTHLIVEVLKDGRPAEPGERGELVATNLISYAMPFIRYRLGDVVTQGEMKCGCGLPYATIREIEGRTLDYFTKPDGSLLHPYDIARVILDSGGWIRTHQLVQERRDRIVLWVEPFGTPPPDAVRDLSRDVCRLLGPGIEFEVIPVPHIEPDPSGKLRYARSLVS